MMRQVRPLLALWFMAVIAGWASAGSAPAGLCDGAWLGFSLDRPVTGSGARIANLESAGPAMEAGLRASDIITQIGDLRVGSPADVANWANDAEPGDSAEVSFLRQGQPLTVTIRPWAVPRAVCLSRLGEHYQLHGDPALAERHFKAALEADPGQQLARQRLDEMAADKPMAATAESVTGAVRADGMKAKIAVGGFDVKAAKATGAIGDGLREMLVSALHQNGYFVVVEREDLRGVLAEQDLSRSPQAKNGSTLSGDIEVADIMVFGAVTEFEPQAGGSSFMTPLRGVPLAMGARITWSQMAMDVRVVDVRTGRVLGAERIPGMARFAQATIAGALPISGIGIPTSLSVYRNTPMEWAIRDCLRKVGYFVSNSIGDEYYRHH